ncbi:hypothetical protein FGL86_00765 [Pistricoccus aurantiacus]|uniref:Porin n=2 Tax=Pistricoccus aurantiacus TaxID=1883414 RepID=A0A5B8SXC3_9GAMM|nr:hypothetical protein FGL86_00765 [Pistricoccus aurantiacus]
MLASVSNAWANGALDTLQVHGFLSQALIVTDENSFFGPSSEGGGSWQFTELGANVSLRPHEDILLAAQVLSRRAGGDASDASPELDYAVLDYQPITTQQRTVGVQLGRFKNPYGFYNQTRDVAFTRPSILLPQSIYFDRSRSLALSGDGINVYWEERIPTGTFHAQLGLGYPQKTNSKELNLGLTEEQADPRFSTVGQLRYEHGGGNFIAALSAASINYKLQIENAERSSRENLRLTPWIISLQYNAADWSLTGEYGLRKLSLPNAINLQGDSDITSESWYVQYIRRMDNNWRWLIRYDDLANNRDDRSGNAYEASGAGPDHSQYARDITLGAQWDIHPQVMLAAEYHHVNGTGWLSLQDNPDPDETKARWNMLLFQLSLRF